MNKNNMNIKNFKNNKNNRKMKIYRRWVILIRMEIMNFLMISNNKIFIE
jgi:hypothetical protein